MRIDIAFTDNCFSVILKSVKSLKECEEVFERDGYDSVPVAHVTVEYSEKYPQSYILAALLAVHELDNRTQHDPVLNDIVSKVFEAGVAYGKSLPR